MGKALKTAGAIIGGAVLVASGFGMVAGLGQLVSIAGVGVGTLNTLSAGAMVVGGMLDKPKSMGASNPTDWTSNPDQPIPFAFGRVGVAGKIVHRDEYGPDNRLQGIVSIFSGAGPIKSFVSFSADDQPVGFVSNGGTAVGKYNRQMWRSWRLGAQPDTALSLPTGLDGGAVMPAWGASYGLSGKACDLLTLQQDSKNSVYPGNAEPKPLTVLDGIHGYDPRYDDTYPGGDGPCRFGVRSTYRYIENPIVAALNWALGLVENGQVVGGIGASLSGVDLPAFVDAANVADVNGWKISAWPDTSEDASAVLDQMLQAGGAVRARHAGKISCVSRGAPRPSVVTITRRDTAGPIELDTGASHFNRLNTITPRLMSEAHRWELTPADPVTFAGLRDEDGGKRGDQVDYRFVPAVKQAAELAAYDILDPREPFSGVVPLKPHMRRLKRGDCFVIDEPGFLMDGVKCLVLSRHYDAKAGMVRIGFRSETDGKHDLALGKTTTLPDYPGLTPADPTLVTPPAPEDWNITPRPPAPDGSQLPIFDFWGAVSNATATGVLVEVSYDETWPGEIAYSGPPTTERFQIIVRPGAVFWLAVSYQRGEFWSERLIFGPYTAPDLIAGGLVGFDDIQHLLDYVALTAEMGAALGQHAGTRLRELLADRALTADAIFRLTSDVEARQRYTQELGFIEGETLGTYAKRRTTELFDGVNALVEDVSLIGARTEDGTAWILDIDTVKVSPDLTLASRLSEMSAATDEAMSGLTALTEATATEFEAAFRQIGLMGAEVGDTGVFRLSETTLQVGTRGALGTVLDALTLTGESNSSSIVTLQDVTEGQASQLTTLSNTVGDQSSSITSLFEASTTLGARWTLSLDHLDRVTGLVADGGTRSFVFLASSLSIVDDGNGLSYAPATGRLRIIRGGQKVVLNATADVLLWSGPTSVADGAETHLNIGTGGMAIGPGVPGGGLYTGRSLFGPFGSSGLQPGPFVLSNSAWTTVATSDDRVTYDGAVIITPSSVWGATIASADVLGAVDWRVISTNLSNGDVVVIHSGTVVAPAGASGMSLPYSEHVYSGTGERRFHLQLRFGLTESDTLAVTVTDAALRGYYVA